MEGCWSRKRLGEWFGVISLKRPREIELMREAGRLVAQAA